MRTWTIRAATAEDLPAIRDCFEAVFGYRRPLECDRSIYELNPSGEAISMIAEADGRVVGHFAVLPVPLQLRGQGYPGGQGSDAMTRAEHRGQGILGALTEACFDRCAEAGIDALYAFPDENGSSYRQLLKANFDHVSDITVAQRPLNRPQSGDGARPRRVAATLAAAMLPRGRRSGFAARACTTDEAPLDEIWDLWQRQGGICRVDRSPDWWRWRFSVERGRYEWIIARSPSGALASAAVLGWRNGQAGLAEIVGSEPAAFESAISTTMRVAEGLGYTALTAATNRPEALRALTRTGFWRRRRLALVVRRISYRTLPANVHTPGTWSVSAADLDTY